MDKCVLHTCCGPCASHCCHVLADAGKRPVLFYSNSNISPFEEFVRRWENVKKLAGILGVEAETYMRKHVPDESSPQGAQIDLIIDRADRVVDVCEMKFTGKPYAIDKDAFANLQTKIDVFRTVTGTRKGIQLVFVTSAGLARSMYSGIVNREITLDDLFT